MRYASWMLLMSFAAFAADVWVSPSLAVTDLVTTGALTSNAAWTGLSKTGPAMLACFADGAVPLSVTSVTVAWSVDDLGHATNLRARGGDGAVDLDGCLTRAISTAEFGATAKDGTGQVTLTPQTSLAGGAQLIQVSGGTTMSGIGGLIGANTIRTTLGTGTPSAGATVTDSTPGDASPKVRIGEPIVLGALDKSVIDAVIEADGKKILACYTRALKETPTLTGKVTVKFVIAKDGSVSSAVTKTTTLNNPTVENCVNGRFIRYAFPEPRGGGIVIASYPLVFSPS